MGFVASLVDRANYHRVWARDGCVTVLAALASGDEELIQCARTTLRTLADRQGPHGEMPSNVTPDTDEVTYGTTVGRVDSALWFVVATAAYYRTTKDDEFLEQMLPVLDRIRFLLGCWEFNNRGLLYVPMTGDWADEFMHHGYVLSDQLLYLWAQRDFIALHRAAGDDVSEAWDEKADTLKKLIEDNFWFHDDDGRDRLWYSKILYQKGREAAERSRGRHWMPFFSPSGYGYRFDALGNALVALVGVGTDEQHEQVDEFIAENVVQTQFYLLPAFSPVVRPSDQSWNELQMMFSYTFRNRPYEYHNGGLWPMVTGFYATSLALRGKNDLAEKYLNGMFDANRPLPDHPGFPEFLHGLTGERGGTPLLAWSAACAVIAHCALHERGIWELAPAQ